MLSYFYFDLPLTLPSTPRAPTTPAPVVQCVITHGVRTQFFRTFGNIQGKVNAAIYAWLASLERVMDARLQRNLSPLPETVYHQFDGGGENANAATVCIAELLVHRGLCRRVVLTRLPVGHTHEDIDQR